MVAKREDGDYSRLVVITAAATDLALAGRSSAADQKRANELGRVIGLFDGGAELGL